MFLGSLKKESIVYLLVFSLLLMLPSISHAAVLPQPDTAQRFTATPSETILFNINTTHRIEGWVAQPSTRGTIDIFWTSVFTIFVCTYTILCLNLPREDESTYRVIGRRLFWMLIAIAGPEFVLTFASGQLGTALASVQQFQRSAIDAEEGSKQREEYRRWTLRHAFFADMGGFVVQPHQNDSHTYTYSYPVTAKQLHWLVVNGFVKYPDTNLEEIWDKSKQDTVAKIITCFQIFYVVLQCIGRVACHLTITTLELSTLAIVVCSIMTSCCWLSKPLDVRTPVKIKLEQDLSTIWAKARLNGDLLPDDNPKGNQTPFDFIDDLLPSWSLNVQPFMQLPVVESKRPLRRFGNDRLPNLRGWQECILCVATLAYAAIHLLGWNFTFPTKTEQLLWRISSMFLFANTAAFWIVETSAAWWRRRRWQLWYYKIFAKDKIDACRAERDEKMKKHDLKDLPLKGEFWGILPLAITYAAARGYLIVEMFIGLRSLDASAYINVDWSSFLPHV